eukprot:7691317-Pyramimonas_sp.AAC.1
MSWVTRQCAPEPLHRASRLQTAVRPAQALPLRGAIRVLEDAIQSATAGLVVPIATDASWAGEEDVVNGRIEPLRSHRARFNRPAGPGFIEGNNDQ